jgi:hypothetical protein
MKQLLSLFLFLLPCLAWAQYPSNGNQKITLGEQSTADGLIWRGVASDTTLTAKSDTAAYFVLDTVNINLYTYKASATGRKWRQLGADTASIAYVNTYGTQTVNGAKTFTTGPIISNSTNGDPNILRLSNTSTGTSAQTTMYILNENTNADGLFLGTLGTLFTTIGGFVQDAGMIGSGANLSGGLSIMTRANQPMRFYTNGHTNERMRIAGNGNIGIGNNNPSVILDINGDRFRINSTTNNAGFFLSESGTNKWSIATVNGDFTFYDEISAIFRFIIKANGNVGIGIDNPAVQFHTTGGVRFATFAGGGTSTLSVDNNGDLGRTSSIELKNNITNIKYGLNDILKINPINFNWKDENKFGNENENGFVAEDVYTVIPNVVSSDANGIFMDYNKLIPILTKAIQEQNLLIKALEQRIINLENK